MKRQQLANLIITLLLTMSLLGGCSQKTSTEKSTAQTAEKVITISSPDDIGTLNPHKYNSEMYAQYFVYENLLTYGENGKLESCLAESWDISQDDKIYTFHLRKGVKFSDGSELTADVVKKNYDAVLKAKDDHSWLELINQIDKTEVVNASTFKLYLKNTYYPALQELTLVRPMRILGAAGFPTDGDTAKEIKSPIGTGPWVLSEHKKGEYAIFTRNENYWGIKPKLSKVIVKVIPDGETAAAALEKGDIDLIYGNGVLSIDTFKELKKNAQLEALQSAPMTTRVIGVNSNKGATKDLAVRLALQYGVDKQNIVDNILYGTEKKADTLFAESFPYCRLGLEARNYDPTKAAKYLEDAGWKIPSEKDYREKDGQILQLDLCFVADDSITKSISEDLQAEFKKIGLKINLIGEEKNSFSDRQKKGNFDLIFGESWGAPYDPHSYVSSFREPSHFDYQAQLGLPMKKTIDENITNVLISTDETSRQKLYDDILRTLHEQSVYLPISYRTNVAVGNKKVTGVTFTVANEVPLLNVDLK
ncbi:nickel ABC transporter substrate-binding protein [Desulfosporosinus sp. BG]|uniref:nickel ABC transporter substrate-binding protein n=1 Tax=Desulfosporosinus sp. BG TaxID=1633135 RepID=UPI00083AB239|nr:nickel ABC transporter substrate-binding protein [Desulfosporosinus sp. BG]ODA42109.1 Nickel ABC transporter, periplasmic nickel-binding protein NikA [Desulfosporosinus sp. BG]